MQPPDNTFWPRESISSVINKLDETTEELVMLQADWQSAIERGDDATADKREIEIEGARRLVHRLQVRREFLEVEKAKAKDVEMAERAEKTKAAADTILARAGKRLSDMEPMAVSLCNLATELEKDFTDWKAARYLAQQSGAIPEGFSNQENEARVSRLIEIMAMSKVRTANICKELSRVSVFM